MDIGNVTGLPCGLILARDTADGVDSIPVTLPECRVCRSDGRTA